MKNGLLHSLVVMLYHIIESKEIVFLYLGLETEGVKNSHDVTIFLSCWNQYLEKRNVLKGKIILKNLRNLVSAKGP